MSIDLFKRVLQVQQGADDLAKKYRLAQENADTARRELIEKIAVGEGTGDPIMDMAVTFHCLSSMTKIEEIIGNYRKIQDLCAKQQGALFFAVQAQPDIADADAIRETFFLGRVQGESLVLPPNKFGLCKFQVPRYVVCEFVAWANEYEYGVMNDPKVVNEPLTNVSLDFANLDEIIECGRNPVVRKCPFTDEGKPGDEDEKPFKSLEIFVGVDDIMDWLRGLDPRRIMIYNKMFQLLDTPQN